MAQSKSQGEIAVKDVLAGLCRPNAYDHEVGEIGIIETHISWVLLAGEFAYKIKKPVSFGFLDFSTLQKRRHYCDEEVRLNRRLAPELYLEVVPVTGTTDCPKISGEGRIIEYAVKMRRFGDGRLLSELSERGELQAVQVDHIADLLADFHGHADVASNKAIYGEAEDIHHWFLENFEHIGPLLDDECRQQQLQSLWEWGQQQWQSNLAVMRQRKEQGFIRECHGDLHLGNMVLIDNKVTAFDCIEFNDKLRWIDVISEAAFVMMDLLHRGHVDFAYRFLNRYLLHSGDYHGLQLLKYYLVYRAMVRAKVSLLQRVQQQDDTVAAEQLLSAYEAYVDLAEKCARRDKVLLIIMHGFSGSGKSTFASQLAEKSGAVWIRSDIERKRIFGLPADAQTASGISSGLYNSDATERTYQRLVDISRSVLQAGFTVIADAAFLSGQQRTLFLELAENLRVPLLIVDCRASEQELIRRIGQRIRQAYDPSEATLTVLEHQMNHAEPLTEQEKINTVTVDTEGNDALGKLLKMIQEKLTEGSSH